MKDASAQLTIGERVSWYRRRRGLTQRVLAELVGRTEDWLSKVEGNRIQLDRLSVINALARELDVALGDLLAEKSLVDWTQETGRRTVPALREALITYRQLIPSRSRARTLQTTDTLVERVRSVWDAYQASRFGYTTASLPTLIEDLSYAVDHYDGAEKVRCQRLLALTYQAMELGNVEFALELGRRVDPAPLPVERQVRHRLEIARLHSARNERDASLRMILDAERVAPEQVRHHALSRDLVLAWMRRTKGAPGDDLTGLATRLNVG